MQPQQRHASIPATVLGFRAAQTLPTMKHPQVISSATAAKLNITSSRIVSSGVPTQQLPTTAATALPGCLQVAPSREVLVGVSNVNPLREGMLDTFLSGVKQAGVSNYLVVALDQETATDLTGRGFNAFHMPIQVCAVCASLLLPVCLSASVPLFSRCY